MIALADPRMQLLLVLSFAASCACLALRYYLRNDHKGEDDE